MGWSSQSVLGYPFFFEQLAFWITLNGQSTGNHCHWPVSKAKFMPN
jgi:hypothetical protein